jgi:hypothetical protein
MPKGEQNTGQELGAAVLFLAILEYLYYAYCRKYQSAAET